MDLKKRFSVRWRLLLPIILSMFLVVTMLVYVQYRHDLNIRKDNIRHQLNLINQRIFEAHEKGDDIMPFLDFVRNYFQNSRLEDLRLSIYGPDGQLITSIGRPFKTPEDIAEAAERPDVDAISPSYSNTGVFYYRRTTSVDGLITVHTAMPWNEDIKQVLQTDDRLFILIIFVSFIVIILLAYLSTNFVINNIKVLREFAHRANDPDFRVDEERLSHDELGDISREVMRLYRGRVKAQEESDKEHAVALHAYEEKRRMQHQLTNNINHELKTPVGVIRGYLETVLTSEDMDKETQTYFLTRALNNVERLCALLADVSTMTRLEEGSGKILITELNFHDLIYGLREDFAQSGILKNMKFEFDLPLKCSVYANNNLLTSVITNLARNSALHSRGTTMGIKILAESDKFYTFVFWDDGCGVPQEHLPHLFERFYRVDAGRSRKSGGTGLGLPIVKSTIESLGGAISVYNRTEGGLQFIFTLKKAL